VKGRLRGSAITLTVGKTEYEGTFSGNRFVGTAKSPNASRIVATRIN
jgi:hypothetical protein